MAASIQTKTTFATRNAGSAEEAGQRLKQLRERLGLRYRDVEIATAAIAQRTGNEEYTVALSRLSDIENKGVTPTLYRLYSLCAVYRLDPLEVMSWYGLDYDRLTKDAATLTMERTQPVNIQGSTGDVTVPVALDPGFDFRKTAFLSRLVERWGRLPLKLFDQFTVRQHRYALVGSEDWSMYPILHPGSLVLIDETKHEIATQGWNSEYDRPIYFIEHSSGFSFGWCSLTDSTLVLQSHPASMCPATLLVYPQEAEILGQVVGVAMRLETRPSPTSP